MSDNTKTRFCTVKYTDRDGERHVFEFKMTFRLLDAGRVVVEWEENTMGSGWFEIPDVGITWKSFFLARRYCEGLGWVEMCLINSLLLEA